MRLTNAMYGRRRIGAAAAVQPAATAVLRPRWLGAFKSFLYRRQATSLRLRSLSRGLRATQSSRGAFDAPAAWQQPTCSLNRGRSLLASARG